MDQFEAHSILESRYERLCSSIASAYQKYRKYPNRQIHRKSTRANIVNDEVLAAVIGEFHDDHGVKLKQIRSKNLRFMQVEESILLWFKKIDGGRKPAIYPTEHARHLQSGGQLSMFPDCEILVVGFLLNRDETKVIRVSIMKPAGRGMRPAWYIDLEIKDEPKLKVMPKGSQRTDSKPGFKVVVKPGAKQDTLIGS